MPCIEKSINPKAKKLLSEVNEIIDAEIVKITNAAQSDNNSSVVSIPDHINSVNKMIIEEANIIPKELSGKGTNAIKLTHISADDPDFIEAMKCPEYVCSAFKNLSIAVFKFVHDGETFYYIRDEIVTDYFPSHQFSSHIINLSTDIINDKNELETVGENKAGDDKFRLISKNFFKKLKNISAANPFMYSLQRQLWPKDESYFENASNKWEFEMLHIILMKMSDVFRFTFQKRVCGRRLDALLHRKGVFTNKPQIICVEVDEDGHKDRNAEDDDKKSNYIKTCGYALFRFSISRSASLGEIEIAGTNAVNDIFDFSKKDVILRSPQLILDSIKKHVIDKNIHDEFVKAYFNKISSRYGPFIYKHTEVGEYFDYSSTKNYEYFRSFIKKNYRLGVDYIEVTENNLAVIYITVMTFNFICTDSPCDKTKKISHEFCFVYQLCYQYLLTLIEINNGNASRVHQYADSEIIMAEVNRMVKIATDNLKKDFEEERQKMIRQYNNAIESHAAITSANGTLADNNKYIEMIEDFKIDLANKNLEMSILQNKLSLSMKQEELSNGVIKKIEREKQQLKDKVAEVESLCAKQKEEITLLKNAESRLNEQQKEIALLKEQLQKYLDDDVDIILKEESDDPAPKKKKKVVISSKKNTSKSSVHRNSLSC